MAYFIHSADRAMVNRTVGGLLVGDRQGILLNANLATTAAAAKAAILTNTLKLHVALRFMSNKVIRSLDLIGNFDSTYLGGSDADKATMLALAPGVLYGEV